MPQTLRSNQLTQNEILHNTRRRPTPGGSECNALKLLCLSRHRLEHETGRIEPRLHKVLGHIKTWEAVSDWYHTPSRRPFECPSRNLGSIRCQALRYDDHERVEVFVADSVPSQARTRPPMPLSRNHSLNVEATVVTQTNPPAAATTAQFYVGDDEGLDEDSDEESYEFSDDESEEQDILNAVLGKDDGNNDGGGSEEFLSIWAVDWSDDAKRKPMPTSTKMSRDPKRHDRQPPYEGIVSCGRSSSLEAFRSNCPDWDLWAHQPRILSERENDDLFTEKHWK